MSAIKAGDWVMVAKPARCCGDNSALGRTYQVAGLFLGVMCSHCRAVAPTETMAIVPGEFSGYRLSRLIKIDPPALPESIERDESVTA